MDRDRGVVIVEDRLRNVIAEILDMHPDEVTPDMVRRECAAWDSMNHLRIITAVEHEFGVTLAMDEIERVQTPAELQRMIDDHLAKQGGRTTGAGSVGPASRQSIP
ncbi:MAG: acyl carrier protein [Pseudomonadota bacterium]